MIAVKHWKKRLKITDKALAEIIDVNQTTVTRALGREPPAWTPAMQKIWEYAKNKLLAIDEELYARRDKTPEDTLKQAVLDAWDGTPEGLSGLVRVLALLREYRNPEKTAFRAGASKTRNERG